MDQLDYVCIKQEFNDDEQKEVLINHRQQELSVGRCTKVKKEEEGGEVKLEWDGDECDCEQCRVEREIKIEFNQTNATNERVKGSLGPFKKGAPFQCKRVKKEEDDDAEWDEDCDCDDCRTMRLKAIRLKQTNATDYDNETGVENEQSDKEPKNQSFQKMSKCQSSRFKSRKSQPQEYSCEKCAKEFKFQSYLNLHIRTHTGEKPYRCPWKECCKAFAQSSNLKQHYKSHISNKMHMCPLKTCKKSYYTESEMKEHHNTHTGKKPYKCTWEDCSKAFPGPCQLLAHLIYHKGEKSYMLRKIKLAKHELFYKCEKCGKGFSKAESLAKHILFNTGKKSFKCPWKGCGKIYGSKLSMKMHYKIHNGE